MYMHNLSNYARICQIMQECVLVCVHNLSNYARICQIMQECVSVCVHNLSKNARICQNMQEFVFLDFGGFVWVGWAGCVSGLGG